jgi:hypothetical protein
MSSIEIVENAEDIENSVIISPEDIAKGLAYDGQFEEAEKKYSNLDAPLFVSFFAFVRPLISISFKHHDHNL